MVNEKFQPPDRLTNYAGLRTLASTRFSDSTNLPLSPREVILVSHLVGLEALRDGDKDKACAFSHVLAHVFETRGMMRFNGLAALLNPNNGYLALFPGYLKRVALYLLDWEDTREREHAQFDWPALQERYPDLF